MCTHCNQGFLEKSFLSHHLLKAHDEIMPADETKEEEKNRFQNHLYLKCLHPVCYALSPYEDDIILNA
jgi:hypothetical protein